MIKENFFSKYGIFILGGMVLFGITGSVFLLLYTTFY